MQIQKKLFVFILAFFHLNVLADDMNKNACVTEADWNQGNKIDLSLTRSGDTDRFHWKMLRFSDYDFLIHKDDDYRGVKTSGIIGVIDGAQMISKDLTLAAGYEIDALDAPMLMISLLLKLLETAPLPPLGEITAATPIDHREADDALAVSTVSASASFPAPWQVSGTVAPAGDCAFEFSLRLAFENAEKEEAISFTGSWKKEENLPPLRGDTDIRGWNVYRIGPIVRKREGAVIYDYGAQLIPEKFDTVAALRAFIAEEEKKRSAGAEE